MKFKRKYWRPGCVYGLPLKDGTFGVCQAIDSAMDVLVYIAVFSYKFEELPKEAPALCSQDVLSLGATWGRDLNNGSLPYVGASSTVVTKRDFPNEAFAESGYVGATHSDVGLYCDFLDACFGLVPWNTMFEPDYWEEYLNTDHTRPLGIRIIDQKARSEYRAKFDQDLERRRSALR